MADAIDFSGAWAVDKLRSATTLEPILQLMGLPWLAIQLVLRLDVTTTITHAPREALVRTVDGTSLGVISTNELRSDGVQVARVGKDGRTALLTCAVSAAPPPGFEWGREVLLPPGGASAGPPLAYLRITTVLPDGEGVSDNAWEMRGGGRVMQAFTTFTKGGRVARASRVLVNRAWQPGRVPEALPLAAAPAAEAQVPAACAPAAAEEAAQAEGGAAAAAAGCAFPLPHLAGEGAAPDPFFITLAGEWVEVGKGLRGGADGAPVGLVGEALAQVLAPLSAALGGSDSGSGGTLRIEHATAPAAPCRHFNLATSALRLALRLDGAWRWHGAPPAAAVLVRAVQAEGQGDLGPQWLGHELGSLPACLAAIPSDLDARVPFFSSAEFEARLYAQGEVRIEVLVPEEGGGGGAAGGALYGGGALPRGLRHALIVRGDGAGRALWLGATAVGMASAGGGGGGGGGGAEGAWESAYPPALRWCALARGQQQKQQQQGPASDAQERARLGGARAVLLQRRALADRERRLAAAP
jgi:hypothetical protein